MKKTLFIALAMLAAAAGAELKVDIEREGAAAKMAVSIEVAGNDAFAKSLRRNLELTGLFKVRPDGAIRVRGGIGERIAAEGMGKVVSFVSRASDAKSARNEARLLANKMCETYSQQRGCATDQIVFVRKDGRAEEIFTCYPDGYDIMQLTRDGKEAVGPRWKDSRTIFYTGFLGAGPQIFELDTATGRRRMKWSFKGLTTGATISPDGRKAAIILSFHGNPELYVIDIERGTWVRLTTTPNASEGQPAWSPDGRQIVYVSDETRRPQLYVIDVATKHKRRLTSKGAQNVDPDWGVDGKIAYITKRGGLSQVAIIDPAAGEGSVRLVTDPGSWEHPSWSKDARHVIASRDKALFIVDTLEDGDAPSRLFMNNGNWITPSWRK